MHESRLSSATPRPAEPAPAGTGVGRLAATVGRLADQLRAAESDIEVKTLIALARGVLMERLRITPAAAARQLAAIADRSGVPVVELAADIVGGIAGDAAGGPTAAGAAAAGTGTGRPARSAASATSATSATSAAVTLNVRLRAAEAGVLSASDVHAAAGSLLRQALAPVGAVAVAIWALADDGSLLLAGHAGFPAGEARRWHHIPPGVETAAQAAVHSRAVHWAVGTGDPATRPSDAGGPSAGADTTRVAIPAELGSRLLGVLEICWPPGAGELPQPVHRQLQALADLCAHTLDLFPGQHPAERPGGVDTGLVDLLDNLREPAMVLLPQHDEFGGLTDFLIAHVNERFVDPLGRPSAAILGRPLLQAYPMAAEDGGLAERIDRVHATGEPFRQDRVVLRAAIGGVPVSTALAVGVSRLGTAVVLTWNPEDEAARLARVLQHAQRLGRMGGFEENLLTGEVVWSAELLELFALPATARPVSIRDLAAHAHTDDAPAISRFVRAVLHHGTAASAAFRLLRGDGVQRYIRIVAEPVLEDGTMTAVRGACQDISAQHWTEIALAATRDRLEHSEREVEEGNRLTLRLQRAIMPAAPTLIEAGGLRIAARYRPAEEDHLVGGDWYDVVVLPNGRILLVVGDVAGHGIDAATEMVALRNALRGLAATGASSARMLRWLGTVAHQMSGSMVTATVVCGVYDPEDRTLRWARAGHPPPLLVRDGTATVPPMPKGMLLGAVGDARYEEETLHLRPGDVLLLYTDGLIERRDRDIDESLRGLIRLIGPTTATLEERLDDLLLRSDADTDDDTCLIGIEVR